MDLALSDDSYFAEALEMKLEEHEKSCLKKFGKPFTLVHLFLDRYFEKYRGVLHRRILHHRLGVEIIRKHDGDEAAKAAEYHIREDMGFLPETWIGHEDYTFFLHDWEEREQEKDLVELYGLELYEQLEQE